MTTSEAPRVNEKVIHRVQLLATVAINFVLAELSNARSLVSILAGWFLMSGSVYAADQVKVSSRIIDGLKQTTFEVPQGTVKLRLPADLATMDNFSGSAIAEPNGTNIEEKIANQSKLEQMTVELKPASGPPIVIVPDLPPAIGHIPAHSRTISIELKDQNHNTVASVNHLCLAHRPPFPLDRNHIQMPSLGVLARPMRLGVFSDTGSGNADLYIAHQSCAPIAASPSNQWFMVPPNLPPGPKTIHCNLKDRGLCATSQIAVLKSHMEADRLLHVGDSGQVRITLTGLSPNTANPRIVFRNLTPGIVRVTGGNYQVIPLAASGQQ